MNDIQGCLVLIMLVMLAITLFWWALASVGWVI